MANITGTAGPDSIAGTPDDDIILGLEGDDVLLGQDGDDTLDGGAGDDALRGRSGADTLLGGDGDDYLIGGEGDDVVDGGSGLDRAGFSLIATDPQVGVTVDLALQGVAQDTGHGLDTLINIEHVSGTIYSDVISGDGNANWLWSGSGAVDGSSGDDVLSGRGGDDLLEVGSGNHTLDGGADNDTVSFYSNGDIGFDDGTGVTVSLALQGAGQDTGHGTMTLTGVENLSGSIADDALTGDAGANVLAGMDGADTLSGGDGNDLLLGDGQVALDLTSIGTSGAIVRYEDLAATLGDPSHSGNDILNGGDGDNTLIGGGGFDTADYSDAEGLVYIDLSSNYGERDDAAGTTALGIDTLIGIEAAVGGAFGDTLVGDDGANSLHGGDGDDIIRGLQGDDLLFGDDGDDLLRGGQGVDSFIGGAGEDRVSLFEAGATQAAYVDLALQQVLNDGFGNAETLNSIEGVGAGTLFADTFLGSGGANFIYGETGDVVDGRGGDDHILLAGAAASVEGGDGIDTLDGFVETRTVDTNGDGVAETETAVAGVYVNLAANVILDDGFGGSGTIHGVENIAGGALDDLLFGDAGDNVISGLDGNDSLRTGGGGDTLDGGAGDDLLRTGSGVDSLIGGDGFDRISFYNLDATQGVVADLRTQTIANDGYGNAETMSSIEGLGSHTRFADLFYGDDGHNLFLAGGGDSVYGFGGEDEFQLDDAPAIVDGGDGIDTLTQFTLTRLKDANGDGVAEIQNGHQGVAVNLATSRILNDGFGGIGRIYNVENVGGSLKADSLTGGGGDNQLWGFEGADLIAGGGGNDTLDGGDGADILNGDGGDDSLVGGLGADSLDGGAGTDALDGGAGQDLLYGQGGADSLLGGDGVDQLFGGAGQDVLSGGLGADLLDGGDGADTLNGDEGADVLIGGAGNDTLLGGDSIDQVTGGLGRDLLGGGAGADRFLFTALSDSTVANSGRDTITDLANADVIDLSAIDADSGAAGDQAFVKVAAFSGVAGQLTLSLSGASTVLQVDVNGDGTADMAITLVGNHLGHGNFVY
jgi:Ca2+-binding RTX toxin-like protein